MSTDIKLSKAQVSKLIRSREFLGSWLSKLACPLMKAEVPLGKKNILAPLGITQDGGVPKKIDGSGRLLDSALQITTLIISKE